MAFVTALKLENDGHCGQLSFPRATNWCSAFNGGGTQMNRFIIGYCASLVLVGSAGAQDKLKPIEESALREALAKPLALIQKSQQVTIKKETCFSCHHLPLPTQMFELARTRGVAFDAAAVRAVFTTSFAEFRDLDGKVQEILANDMDAGWVLTTAHAFGVPADVATSAIAQRVATNQQADGGWRMFDQRPPQSHGRITTTAVIARGISLYLPEQFKEEKETRLRHARAWLLKAQPQTTEERTYQLFGLLWTGADEDVRKNAAKQLLAEQRKDGGWSQLPRLASDAYSTGEVLSALHQAAGLATTDPAYQRGLRFLLSTQKPDGSWFVESRLHPPAPVSPPYFQTGFPYGKNQFISIMGTEWAAMALLHAIPPIAKVTPRLAAGTDTAPTGTGDWIRVILNGSLADLKKALDGGMKPNAKTKKGTTALMFAARDPAKVKLLLDRGADADARAESGISALMVASHYRGNAEVVRLLLKHGAKVNPPKDVKVKDAASAILYAATTGDTELARVLIDAGAHVGDKMLVFGLTWVNPLAIATSRGDTAMMEFLIEKRADLNWEDGDKITPLGWAVLANHAPAVKLLIAKGAKVNHVDKLGMTPLLYAASIDYGDTAVVEALLAGGADPNAKDEEGRTALELAKAYQHTAITKVLSDRGPDR
jgi:ankyrin repeat protein